jgi:nicotinate-nucleotide pyrophosphorylase (carboxylating)
MLLSELEHFIAEDLGEDIYPPVAGDISCDAVITARRAGIIAGISEACQIFTYFNASILHRVEDGTPVEENTRVLEISGSAENILKAERLALNFIGRMSGIATLTHTCRKLAGNTVIAGTRKTTPGFRKFEKKAIILGGGDPHRYNLSDAVMIKDNHIKLLGIEKAIQRAKKTAGFTRKIEIEVENMKDAIHAATLGVDIIMLDNCTPQEIRDTIEALEKNNLRKKIILEASGNITPQNIAEYAATGVDVLSLGSITHSAKWLDVSLSIKTQDS